MEEQNIDRRVRKTKRQLRQALMMLMSEKPSKSISVRELAERADINRGTFYIHYKDVSDLLQRLEDEMAERHTTSLMIPSCATASVMSTSSSMTA